MSEIEYRVKTPFLQVQNALIDDTDHFDKFEKWVWIVLARHGYSGYSWPSQKTIGDKVGITDRKVRDILKSLEQKGWIERAGVHEKDKTVKWIVQIPEHIEIKWLEDYIETKKKRGQAVEEQKEEKEDPPKKEGEPKERIPFEEIIGYLNEKADKKFRHNVEKNKEHIRARWNEGYTIEDIQHVIDVKTEEWKGHPEMDKNLNPITLFRPSNFEKYLNQKMKRSKQPSFPPAGSPKPQQSQKPVMTEEERRAMLAEVGIQV
jgi:uncharacterized phage protein (TIGR02220 family)